MKNKTNSRLLTGALLASFMLAGSLQAQVIFTVSDNVPDGDSGSGTRSLSTSLGTVTAPPAIATTTYTISNLDFTSIGGTASETVAFDIAYSQTGGTGVQFNGFGNISVTGNGDNNQVEPDNGVLGRTDETLTATLSLNAGLTTYNNSLISLGFTESRLGGFDSDETYELITSNGTTTVPEGGSNVVPISPSSNFFTLAPIDTDKGNDAMNLSGFDVQITAVAVPEPSAALLMGFALMGLLIRRRSR